MNDQATSDERQDERTDLLDGKVLACKIRGAQSAALFTNRPDFAREVEKVTGYRIKDSTMGAIARGDQPPSLRDIVAITLTVHPDIGIHYFIVNSLPEELADVWRAMHHLPPREPVER